MLLKSQLINELQNLHRDIHLANMKEIVDDILNRMVDTLLSQDRIEIRGFGSFDVHYYPSRRAHNPRSGEFIIAGPTAKPHFKAGCVLNAAINRDFAEDQNTKE